VPASYLRQLYLTPGDGACEQGCTSGSPAIPGSDALNDMFAGRALRGAERDALAAGTSLVFDPASSATAASGSRSRRGLTTVRARS
jgi:hypothetical protein